MVQIVHGEVGSPKIHGFAIGQNISPIKDVARPPPKYTCVSILGVCGKTITQPRCYQLCRSYFSGANPYPHCDQYPGIDEVLCFCEHDCLKPQTASPPIN